MTIRDLRNHGGEAGRRTSAGSYDAMIAATAMANDLAVYTCNPEDFDGVEAIVVIEVPHPDAMSTKDEQIRR